jgi:hypothetical protein
MESEIISPKERPTFIQTRTVKDCIKPNNVIEKDVKLCVQGLKEPTWVMVPGDGGGEQKIIETAKPSF